MITFALSIALLVGGYFLYSKHLEKIMDIDPNRPTPAVKMSDGIDYVPMSWWRVLLIQFLNIAGLGPIFGAIAGAMWGPVAFLWITLKTIFGGAVHDYFSGMLSVKHDGKSITEIIGIYMGKFSKQIMRIFTIVLLILVGVVFISGPAGLLAGMTPSTLDFNFWVWVIFIYYILATLMPIDKIIGKIYPLFGFSLLFMAISLIIALIVKGYHLPELTLGNFKNFHHESSSFPIFPMMFSPILSVRSSDFNAHKLPLLPGCLKTKREVRRGFNGQWVLEEFVRPVWQELSMTSLGGL